MIAPLPASIKEIIIFVPVFAVVIYFWRDNNSILYNLPFPKEYLMIPLVAVGLYFFIKYYGVNVGINIRKKKQYGRRFSDEQ